MKMSHYTLLAIGLALVVGVAVISALADDATDRAKLQQQLDSLLGERVETAQTNFNAWEAAYIAESCTLGDMLTAMDEYEKASLALIKNTADQIAVLERSVEIAAALEAKVEQLYRISAKGGEAKDYNRAKLTRQNAQIALILAKINAPR